MSRVSVIIPSYNQARYVAATLDSLLAQTYRDFEIIVVNDGSTDETEAVLKPYQANIYYIYQANKGLSGARNAGFRASSGEYLVFLDSDDLLRPDALARFVEALDQQRECGLAYCAWQQISADGKEVLGENHPRQAGHVLKKLLLREFFFFASAAMLRRACLEKVGLFDEKLPWGDDADLWLRIARAGYPFAYLDEPLLQYRVHTASMTAAVTSRQIQGWQDGLKKFFADSDLPDDIRNLQAQAYSTLYYETAGRCYRAEDTQAGKQYLKQALAAYPNVTHDWVLNWLAGTALDPRTPEPQAFIERVLDHLPDEAATWERLRKRALGRYHAAAVFAAYNSCDWPAVRRHLWPALQGDRALLGNRGFWRITVEALLKRQRQS